MEKQSQRNLLCELLLKKGTKFSSENERVVIYPINRMPFAIRFDKDGIIPGNCQVAYIKYTEMMTHQ